MDSLINNHHPFLPDLKLVTNALTGAQTQAAKCSLANIDWAHSVDIANEAGKERGELTSTEKKTE